MATGQESNQQSGQTQGAAGGQTAPAWDSLKDEVGDMAGTAMEQGRQILDSAREQATGYADQRKGDVAETVTGLAKTLRESGTAFDGQPGIRAIVESAAGGLEQFADKIRTRSFAEMFGDVEGMVRRRPVAAAALTMAAGFLAARFVKASSDSFGEARRNRPADWAGQPQTFAQRDASARDQPRA